MEKDRTGPTRPRYRGGAPPRGGALREFAAEFLLDPSGLTRRLVTMGSPVVLTRLGPFPVWLVFNAQLAREVLASDEASYRRPALIGRVFVEALGANLFTASGSAWSRRRRLLQPQFTRSHVDGLVDTMAVTISDRVGRWPADTTVDMQARLTDLTLRVAARVLIGLDLDRDALGPALRHHFEGLLGWMSHRFFHPTAPPALVPTPRNRQMARDRVAIRAIVSGLVAERRRSAEQPMDVLSLLIEATDEDGRPLSDDQIADECIGFLFAGHETTAAALTWALYLLATNPSAQDRVADESQRLLGSGAPTAEAVEDLSYTARVVEETLRLYPPAAAIVRIARRSTSLGDYRLRRGTVVALPLYAIHRDPGRWPDPETFNPDRFSPNRTGADSYASLPFGLGPRQCLGARFALTEARLALAIITSRWHVGLDHPIDPKPLVQLALRIEGGLPMLLHRRDPVGGGKE